MVSFLEKQQTEIKDGGGAVGEKAGMDHEGGGDHVCVCAYTNENSDTSIDSICMHIYVNNIYICFCICICTCMYACRLDIDIGLDLDTDRYRLCYIYIYTYVYIQYGSHVMLMLAHVIVRWSRTDSLQKA